MLDDLHWADPSTVELLRFSPVSRGPVPAAGRRVPPARAATRTWPPRSPTWPPGRLVPLQRAGRRRGGRPGAWRSPARRHQRAGRSLVHERSGGHPFFARELCRLLAAGGAATGRSGRRPRRDRPSPGPAARPTVPAAGGCRGSRLDAAARRAGGGDRGRPDDASALAGEARGGHPGRRRTTAAAGSSTTCTARRSTPACRRAAGGSAPSRRAGAGPTGTSGAAAVFPAELARHFAAAVTVAGTAPALAWADAAAEPTSARFAFAEAAGHLARVRSAVRHAARGCPTPTWSACSPPRRTCGCAPATPRPATCSTRVGPGRRHRTADLLGAVALGLDRVGARFAMPRGDLVAVLDAARAALDGAGTATEAKVTAALARQLQHSVPADRPRAAARRAGRGDRPCARRPGHAGRLPARRSTTRLDAGARPPRGPRSRPRSPSCAQRAGDPERHAQALLLSATAQLENGSPAFRATLAEYQLCDRAAAPASARLSAAHPAGRARPARRRHRRRRAALSARRPRSARRSATRDTGNVRLSQRLEVVRARGDGASCARIADDAVRWWIGAPAHAHAVAAGFWPGPATSTPPAASSTPCSRSRLAHRPLVPVVGLHRRAGRGGHRARRPPTVSAAAR